jgi:hypothetical protein
VREIRNRFRFDVRTPDSVTRLFPEETFGQCIFERDKAGQLLRVKYGSVWKRIRRDPRSNLDRRRLNEPFCVPIRDERKNLTDRRNPRRLTCGDCGKDFPDVPSMAEHHPCKASHELVLLGFWDFLEGIKQNGGPSNGEIEKLRNIVLASLSEDAYVIACGDQLFSPQRHSGSDDNRRAYRLAWFAALLSLIRPIEINLNLLTRIDREEISRIVETFIRLPDGPQKRVVRQLFALSIRLEEIGKTGRVPEKPISGNTRTAFVETEGTRGERRARAMTILGADHWSPLTPLQAYHADAIGFSRDLYTLGSRIRRKTKKSKKSSPASR